MAASFAAPTNFTVVEGVRARLDAEYPDGNNGAEHNYAADGPARGISRTIRFRSIDHGIVPMGHGGLLSVDTASSQ